MADDSIFTRIGYAVGAFRGGGESIEKASQIPTNTIGTSMTSPGGDGTYIDDAETYWTDRELNLIGPARWLAYEEMLRNVAIIAAGVRLFLNLLANAVWTFNPPEGLSDADTKVAQGYADQATEIIFGMTSSWTTVIRKIAMFRLKGFSIMEWTAVKRPDGLVGFLDIEHRPQRTIVRWTRDPGGTVLSVTQRVAGRPEVVLPRSKIIYAVDDMLTDSPEGMGLFRHLAVTAERLKAFMELEEVGYETDLRGIPIASAPLGELQREVKDAGPEGSPERAKAENRRQRLLTPFREFIEKHVRNKKTGMLKPSDTFVAQNADTQTISAVPKWSLELLKGDSTAFADVANAIKEMKLDLARVLGVEHMLLGGTSTGSYALAKSKVGTFYLTVTSTLYDMLEVIDRDAIDPLGEMNGWPEHLRPETGVNEISDTDIEQVLNAIAKLAASGAPLLPDDPAVGEIYDLMGLTRPPERVGEMDMSLNPKRPKPGDPKKPTDPNQPVEGNPEPVKKAKVLRSGWRRRRAC